MHDADSVIRIRLNGQEAHLLADKALFLPASGTLIVADVHLGKAASFRARRFFAPDGVSARDLQRLSHLLKKHQAERLLVLGDLVHHQDGLTKDETELFDDFRHQHAHVQMALVLGNHDRRARLPQSWKIELIAGALRENNFVFCHEYNEHIKERRRDTDQCGERDEHYVLSGHIHPAVVLYGQGNERARLPCFWLRRRYGVLPSFGVFTGSYTVTPSERDRVFVIAQDSVVRVNKSPAIK